ncbi:sulfite exporter TauE/SafE family protein [Sinomonas sp. ASV322]|uniref:sulfite exporter TauE/SafE family protein n=1 Tax=Sinomonas sp. ASV322 TaxID=3041920 RepID=UPI0027DE6644|nr:sulfite exporter TauE/SafE family protein [Sinomonas sp. ASV322]MDQ4502744.1 sulfite exporter TauE/SafE family protein [Sinomonas sp. ASV322]
MLFAVVLLAVVVGATAQRVAGLGFGLMVSPVLVVLLGPLDGVMIVNACGATSSLLILSRVWRDVEWRRYLGLIIPGFAGIAIGAFLASHVAAAPLEIGIGLILVAGLVGSQLVARAQRNLGKRVDGLGVMAASGFSSGLMNAAAAVGGPAVTAYAVLSRWDQRRFGATLQPYFITTGTTSLLAKVFATGGHWPELEFWQWMLIFVCMVAGIVAGDFLARRVAGEAVRRVVIVIAYAGAALAIFNGIGHLTPHVGG